MPYARGSAFGGLAMVSRAVHCCQCRACLAGDDHHQRDRHRQLNLLMSRLDEQQRRWLAALESNEVGHGGDTLVSLVTGLHVDTIRRGREELAAGLADRPADRVRKPGAGRPPVQKKTRRSSPASTRRSSR
jgi:hypothetical protein